MTNKRIWSGAALEAYAAESRLPEPETNEDRMDAIEAQIADVERRLANYEPLPAIPEDDRATVGLGDVSSVGITDRRRFVNTLSDAMRRSQGRKRHQPLVLESKAQRPRQVEETS